MRKKENYTQDYVPISDVIDGVVITEDGRYIKILEIHPINFPMKTPVEQAAILDGWEGWLRTSPTRFTIKCVTRQTPINKYTASFDASFAKEESELVRQAIDEHCSWAATLGSGQSIDHKFYIIFEYEKSIYQGEESEEEIIRSLNHRAKQLAAGLGTLGNLIIEDENQTISTCEFLYEQYNRRLIGKESFEDRFRRYEHDVEYVNNAYGDEEYRSVYIKDILSPRSLNTKDSPEYMLIDGMYFSYLYVRKDYYPSEMVTMGWLSSLINRGYGIEVDLFFSKRPTLSTLSSVKRKRRLTGLKLSDRDRNSSDYEKIRSNVQALDYTIEKIASEKEEAWDMNILITVCAYTKQDLFRKRDDIIKLAKRDGYEIGSLNYMQEDGFYSTMPLCKMTKPVDEKSRHNVLTEVIKAAYPFTSYALNDEDGILIGQHQQNGSLAIYNQFDSRKYPNANMTIFGGSGRGKTFSLLTLTTRLRYKGIRSFILAPDKQDEFRRTCEEIDGEFIDISAAAVTRINPFDIWPIESEADSIINNKTGQETSWLVDKIAALDVWVSMLVDDLTQSDRIIIKRVLEKIYYEKGITKDNASLYLDREKQVMKEMPTYSDFVNALSDEPTVPGRVIEVFSQFTSGVYRNLNGQTNVDLKNKYIVFGMEKLNGELKAPMMYIMLKFIWSVAKSDKTEHKAIVIDEGSLLVDGKEPLVGDFVVEIFKMIRGYGGAGIFATQSIADLYKNDGEFGNAILSNSHSHILMGMEPTDIEFIRDTLKLSDREASLLASFKNPKEGRAILCAGATHIPIFVRSSQKERDMFDTTAEGLRKIKKRKELETAATQKNI